MINLNQQNYISNHEIKLKNKLPKLAKLSVIKLNIYCSIAQIKKYQTKIEILMQKEKIYY